MRIKSPEREADSSTLLIVGGSARAAAQSASRAGAVIYAADCFADVDLRQAAAHCVRIERYPHDLPGVFAVMPAGPWMYTGALENHPDLIERLAQLRPLFGNSADVLRAVRDPNRLFSALQQNGFDVLPWNTHSKDLPANEQWIRKPLRSAAGINVRRWLTSEEVSSETKAGEYCYQRFQPGTTLGLSFVANGHSAAFLAAAEHLVAGWSGAQEFAYAGSIGPIELSATVRATSERLGNFLAHEFKFIGLFGVDVVLNDDRIWPLEVNPRYTASMELIERAAGVNMFSLHRAACLDGRLPADAAAQYEMLYGKAILYADQPCEIGHQFNDLVSRLNQSNRWQTLADIPAQGTQIRTDQPICTVFAEDANRETVLDKLKQLALQVRAATCSS